MQLKIQFAMPKFQLLIAIALLGLAACRSTDAEETNGASSALPQSQVSVPDTLKTKDTASAKADLPAKPKRKVKRAALHYSEDALRAFKKLARETKGEAYYCRGAARLPAKLREILGKHAVAGTDVVFLIDNTGSMVDDIDAVKANVTRIISDLGRLPDVRMAVATYGDSVYDGEMWYNEMDFTADVPQLQEYIEQIGIAGGGDLPESVYDGIWNVCRNLTWRSDTKRMILVIGDAPPLEHKKQTTHSLADVLASCRKNDILVNLYPVLVSYY